MSDNKTASTSVSRPHGGHGGPGGPGPGGPGMRPTEKARNFKGSMTRLLKFMGQFKLAIAIVVIFAIGSTVFNILGPKVLSTATTELFEGVSAKIAGTGGIDFDAIAKILITTLGIYALSAICSFVQSWNMSQVSQKTCYLLRKRIADKIDNLPMAYFEKASTGDVLSRITNDIDTLGQSLNQGITQFITSLTTIIGVLAMMFSINVSMTLIVLLIIPVSLILVGLIVSRSQRYFRAQQKNLGVINGQVEEAFSGHQVIKAYCQEEETLKAYSETNEKLYDSAWKSQFLSGLMPPAMNTVGNLGYVGVAISGAAFAIQGIITVGDIQAFIQYVKNFTQPISQLAQISNVFQMMAAAAERIFEFLDVEEEPSDEEVRCASRDTQKSHLSEETQPTPAGETKPTPAGETQLTPTEETKQMTVVEEAQRTETPSDKKINTSEGTAKRHAGHVLVAEGMPETLEAVPEKRKISGEVEFDHVRFGYDSNTPIIHDFCAHVMPGQTVALVGPTGAGKTTMVKLLMRFYDVDSGAIRIDGCDVRDLSRNEVRSKFAMVLQDTWLFSGSIRENIRYGRLDATDEEVEAAAKAAFADHFISTLPGGYDMEINEDASNISQGQRQLLTIARAVLADRDMLILDEATSSVDTRTEERIQMAMDYLMQGRTSFVIAHRLSTIRNADLILVIQHGDIVEQGTHAELLARGGAYASLYNSQFFENSEES